MSTLHIVSDIMYYILIRFEGKFTKLKSGYDILYWKWFEFHEIKNLSNPAQFEALYRDLTFKVIVELKILPFGATQRKIQGGFVKVKSVN